MSEFGVTRELDAEPGLEREPEPADEAVEDPGGSEPAEEYADADPQEWISRLTADLERAEQGIGSGPRDALMARIKLAQAYSELGDTVQAAPLAVQNAAQAERLFPGSEGMLQQLRKFRDAACEAAGWTAAMMRQPDDPDPEPDEEPSELVARPWPAADAVAEAWPAVEVGEGDEAVLGGEAAVGPVGAAGTVEALPEPSAEAEPAAEAAPVAEAAPFAEAGYAHEPGGGQYEPLAASEAAGASRAPEFFTEAAPAASADPEPHQTPEPEPVSVGAVIHEFVRRASEPPYPAYPAMPLPSEFAVPEPLEPDYADEIPSMLPATDITAVEEIIRLRYELREAHRTVDRLRHVNRKLREALDFEAE